MINEACGRTVLGVPLLNEALERLRDLGGKRQHRRQGRSEMLRRLFQPLGADLHQRLVWRGLGRLLHSLLRRLSHGLGIGLFVGRRLL